MQNIYQHIKQLIKIGIALSIEKDINKLLEMIVDEARSFSNADAGTLYIVDEDTRSLRFEILQNDTMKDRMGGTSKKKISLPNVSMYKNDKPNHSNVSSYVALTGEIVNVPDVYETKKFDFTGPRNYDAATGYRSKSMLVLPMKNHENNIIGVLQLLNAQDLNTKEIIPFQDEFVDMINSLASQAAVAVTNVQLIAELKNLFYAFIKSIATAIDEKSPYTGGHIRRVTELTMNIADKINETDEGPFQDVHFNNDELEELRIAAWMHDVGKITTPESVVDKSTKLEAIFDRIELVKTRFKLIEKSIENKYLQKKIKLLQKKGDHKTETKNLDKMRNEEIAKVHEEIEFITSCNKTGEFIADEIVERLKKIAAKTFIYEDKEFPYLDINELNNLCIRKGTLISAEREIIENHAKMTLKITEQLPFPKNLSNVPLIASAHHEKINGSGYPQKLSGDQIPLQARILAVADIFEALTAKDRPYKDPMKLSTAVNILNSMKAEKHIDPDIYDLFIGSHLHDDYAKKELDPAQIDNSETKKK
ncbi:MAG: GAF domain-containing protein [Desulfobacterales bacterium]|jgi:HD-GYP domain-containing protein (c-di-GMP phosphodiesterase class II)|nr:GAF domain-containing protein [Desulfobacteraceae bacterium]MBT4364286.1 GAF domain-containing protein [Desulfobacteraceae bacterium]MBT7086911.1 GAF domain-containing protein [Desulfobacterales bacterium]